MYRVVIIGSGFSGLALGIRLKAIGIHDFIILEKAQEVGGTWRENTYPGAECDIPSALYSFSFEPNPHWEYKWSHQPQILEYLRHCAQKYGLYPHIRFGQEVKAAHFQEKEAGWKIITQDNTTFFSQSLVSAVGQLHHPRIPSISGQEKFVGPSWHSARWNHDVPLEGKRVGVIGNAASAVQFIPQIAPRAGQLYIFQRSANWMLPKQDRPYLDWEKKMAARFPILLKLYRNQLWLKGGALFFLMGQNQGLKKLAESYVKRYIQETVHDPILQKKLIPDYPIGAKRILFSDDYYPTLNRSNVHLITENIQEITEKGLRLREGTEIDLDVIIFGTGFQTNPFLMGLDVRGQAGKSIHEAWAKGAEAYLGITTSGFPNLFLMYGPNTNLGHNSIVIMSECQAHYISQCIATLKKHHFRSMDVKPEVQKAYNAEIQRRLQHSVWAQIEDSWYKSGGKITNNWPGRTMEYEARTRKVNYAAYRLS
ncbi:MAG: NAD(P)/FAD-dependent oxidoreductase [Microscillaceae bacterium]